MIELVKEAAAYLGLAVVLLTGSRFVLAAAVLVREAALALRHIPAVLHAMAGSDKEGWELNIQARGGRALPDGRAIRAGSRTSVRGAHSRLSLSDPRG